MPVDQLKHDVDFVLPGCFYDLDLLEVELAQVDFADRGLADVELWDALVGDCLKILLAVNTRYPLTS